jgi:ABC-type nitrate/sulfonate/bicarbonate transport system ATPase subunit
MGCIQIRNIDKHYHNRRDTRRSTEDHDVAKDGRIEVLQNIALNFDDGEMVCFLGPSGCGKTTLLRIIAGFEKPTGGTVHINSKAVSQPNSDCIFVFQHNGLLPWMTVRDNVGLGLRNWPSEEERNSRIKEYVEIVELEGFENHFPHQLSGGMKRRAELARALVVNPDMLIMDEPFSGLDFLTHMKMREEVVNMHEYFNKTTLVVTHDIDDALIMGDRIVILSGRPSTVKFNQKIDFARPRNFEANPDLNKLRAELFFMLGVPYAV